MSKIEKRVVVNCSLERLFTYVPEVEPLPELWPGLLEVGEVQRLPRGGVTALNLDGDHTYWSQC